MSLGTLRTVNIGSVVPLETPVGAPTRLIADGEPIASGEIVDIQGRLALRITHLGRDDA
jgi:flagellar motor switch/type III secretory pathway protein FliN